MHRNLSLAILASVSALGVLGAMSTTSAAQAVQDNFCLQGRQSGHPGDCESSSYQQCMATASGTGESCGINRMKAYSQRRGGYSRY
jgi:hypothetical protein